MLFLCVAVFAFEREDRAKSGEVPPVARCARRMRARAQLVGNPFLDCLCVVSFVAPLVFDVRGAFFWGG